MLWLYGSSRRGEMEACVPHMKPFRRRAVRLIAAAASRREFYSRGCAPRNRRAIDIANASLRARSIIHHIVWRTLMYRRWPGRSAAICFLK